MKVSGRDEETTCCFSEVKLGFNHVNASIGLCIILRNRLVNSPGDNM